MMRGAVERFLSGGRLLYVDSRGKRRTKGEGYNFDASIANFRLSMCRVVVLQTATSLVRRREW